MRIGELLGKRSYQLLAVGALIVVAYFGYAYLGQMMKGHELAAEVDRRMAENQVLREEQVALQSQLELYESGGYEVFAEREARESLNMARAGDVVLLPVYEDQDAEEPSHDAGRRAGGPGGAGEQSRVESWLDRLLQMIRP